MAQSQHRNPCIDEIPLRDGGEGMEYGWGYAKKVFRSIPLQQKRTKDDFWKGVEESLHKTSVDIMHRMSAKARRYMLTY